MPDRTLTLTAEDVPILERILGRSIAADATEIRRLTTLGSAYFDRPAGRNVDSELDAARRQHDVAVAVLGQLLG